MTRGTGAIVRTSEPVWRAPMSQSQRERSRGRIEPMEHAPRVRASGIVNGLAITAMLAALLLFVIVPLVRYYA